MYGYPYQVCPPIPKQHFPKPNTPNNIKEHIWILI
jgi:hypothetical protein